MNYLNIWLKETKKLKIIIIIIFQRLICDTDRNMEGRIRQDDGFQNDQYEKKFILGNNCPHRGDNHAIYIEDCNDICSWYELCGIR